MIFPATCSTSIIRISPLDLHKEFDSPASYTLVVVAEIDVKRLVFKRNLLERLIGTFGDYVFEFFSIDKFNFQINQNSNSNIKTTIEDDPAPSHTRNMPSFFLFADISNLLITDKSDADKSYLSVNFSPPTKRMTVSGTICEYQVSLVINQT